MNLPSWQDSRQSWQTLEIAFLWTNWFSLKNRLRCCMAHSSILHHSIILKYTVIHLKTHSHFWICFLTLHLLTLCASVFPLQLFTCVCKLTWISSGSIFLAERVGVWVEDGVNQWMCHLGGGGGAETLLPMTFLIDWDCFCHDLGHLPTKSRNVLNWKIGRKTNWSGREARSVGYLGGGREAPLYLWLIVISFVCATVTCIELMYNYIGDRGGGWGSSN